MRITAHHDYDADPETVFEMLTDPEWLTAVAQRAGATSHEAKVQGDNTQLTAAMPAPSAAQRFTGPELVVHLNQDWGAAGSDGGRQGRLEISVEKMPAAMRGTATLRPAGSGTTIDYDGELEVRVPIVGRKLEAAAAPYVTKVLDMQEQVGREWLAER